MCIRDRSTGGAMIAMRLVLQLAGALGIASAIQVTLPGPGTPGVWCTEGVGGACRDNRNWTSPTTRESCLNSTTNSELSEAQQEQVFGYGSCDHQTYHWPPQQCLNDTWDRHDGTCINCAAGRYSVAGSSECTECVAVNGSYPRGCSDCQPNTYDTKPGGLFQDIGCEPCGTFTYSSQVGSSECVACTNVSGHWNSECSQCPPSTYDASPGGTFLNQNCTACPVGKYSTGIGNAECTECVDSDDLWNAECSTCPANTYDAIPGSSFLLYGEGCTDCPLGNYSVGPGSSRCLNCTVTDGKWNSECSRCPASTYDASPGGTFLNQNCTACPVGKYSTGIGNAECTDCVDSDDLWNAECSTCPANTYDAIPGSSFLLYGEGCTDCPLGNYSVGPGSSRCLDCTVTDGKWNSECSSCLPNHFDANPGGVLLDEGCTPCPSGTFSNGIGTEQCTDCNASLVTVASDGTSHERWQLECSAAPDNTYDPEPGGIFKHVGFVPCSVGNYSVGVGNVRCTPCTNWTDAAGNQHYQLECSGCPADTYDSQPGGNHRHEGCVACEQGKYSEGIGNVGCNTYENLGYTQPWYPPPPPPPTPPGE
eukprot:TRINITY_DN1002_c0_g1_i10.p1 TRINITY_DN1002_c0_g1~~TRINITY_DN1002_c0_g1_i10.p1  ORF type:complete len:592 (-),score=94.28 TRINITY_DN1002_c0_g1_i10:307-2082(-)